MFGSLVFKAEMTPGFYSTLPSIPAGENQLHFDFLMMEAGEGGQAEEFTPGLSLGEQPHLFPAQKPCL